MGWQRIGLAIFCHLPSFRQLVDRWMSSRESLIDRWALSCSPAACTANGRVGQACMHAITEAINHLQGHCVSYHACLLAAPCADLLSCRQNDKQPPNSTAKDSGYAPTAENVLSERAYEKPSWHHQSPKSFLRLMHVQKLLQYNKVWPDNSPQCLRLSRPPLDVKVGMCLSVSPASSVIR